MHVDVGPVPSVSVLAWLNYAKAVLTHDENAPAPGDDIPPDATGSFVDLIAEWYEAASRDPEFHWQADVSSEVAEYLVLAFYRIVQRLAKAAEARGTELSPPEGHVFYLALVHGLLDALAERGPRRRRVLRPPPQLLAGPRACS